MLSINPTGTLVITTNSNKEIPVTGLIFMENIYAMKCIHYAITGKAQAKSQIIDDTVKFAIQ